MQTARVATWGGSLPLFLAKDLTSSQVRFFHLGRGEVTSTVGYNVALLQSTVNVCSVRFLIFFSRFSGPQHPIPSGFTVPKQNKKSSKSTDAEPAPVASDEPKESADQGTKTYTLKVRLTTAEQGELEAAAKGEAHKVSTWARAVLLREARRLQSRKDKK